MTFQKFIIPRKGFGRTLYENIFVAILGKYIPYALYFREKTRKLVEVIILTPHRIQRHSALRTRYSCDSPACSPDLMNIRKGK